MRWRRECPLEAPCFVLAHTQALRTTRRRDAGVAKELDAPQVACPLVFLDQRGGGGWGTRPGRLAAGRRVWF
eukprot:495943-Prymnesium_polylepis.1